MESYIKSPNSKRFVVEDSITKVTSDGEPHEMMTMVAGLSGLLAAIIILAILVSMVARRKSKQSLDAQPENDVQKMESAIPTISQDVTAAGERVRGNLNAAFRDSELSLNNSLAPKCETVLEVERY